MIGSAATAATSFVENNAGTVTHAALGVATFVPGIGSLAAVADAGLYTYEGDYTAAGLAMLAVVPGGVILGKAALIARTAAKVDKFVNVVNDANKIERLATDIGKVENVATDLNRIQKTVNEAERAASGARSVTLDQAMAAARRNGIDTRMLDVTHEAGAEAASHAYGYTPLISGRPIRGAGGRLQVVLTDRGLRSEADAVNTIAHELHHVRAGLRGDALAEDHAAAYAAGNLAEEYLR